MVVTLKLLRAEISPLRLEGLLLGFEDFTADPDEDMLVLEYCTEQLRTEPDGEANLSSSIEDRKTVIQINR